MDRVRTFTQNDIPQVAELYQRVFCGAVKSPLKPLAAYFDEVFFQNPWYDRNLSSLVYERDERNIVGFLGVIPRRLVMKGRSLRVAVSTQLMVENNNRNSLAGLKLLQAFFSGPQDLSLTDGANESSRRIWKTLGGVEIPIYSICWTRTLRPSRDAVDALGKKQSLLQIFAVGYKSSCRIKDSINSRIPHSRLSHSALHLSEADLDIRTLLDNLPRLSRAVSLRPEYDHVLFEWLLGVAEKKKKHGPLLKRVLRNAEGKVEGWYVYYLNVGGTSQVLQLVTSPQSFSTVLEHLFSSVLRQGSTAVSGRLEPQYLHEFSRQHCRFSAGSAVLVHTRDQELLKAICTGDTFLSRLDGEWWTCFNEFVGNRYRANGYA